MGRREKVQPVDYSSSKRLAVDSGKLVPSPCQFRLHRRSGLQHRSTSAGDERMISVIPCNRVRANGVILVVDNQIVGDEPSRALARDYRDGMPVVQLAGAQLLVAGADGHYKLLCFGPC